MELLLIDLIRPYAADVLGSSACVATLLTFAQTRMWPMRISAIAANLLFIGYGALGLLYPVLFLHLVLLPLNVARLIQLAQKNTNPHTSDPELPRPILVPAPLPNPTGSIGTGLAERVAPTRRSPRSQDGRTERGAFCREAAAD